jgi:hypothetical protein
VLRSFLWILLSALLAVALPGAALGAGFAVTMSRDFAAVPSAPPSPPSSRPTGRIPVAVLVGKNGSVATDVLGPFDVLASSPAFDVYTVSVTSAPVALSGGLHVVPDYPVATAPTPRIVVVPAFSDPAGADEAPLRALIERVHRGGGTVVSICSGARVLAATDVLDGRRARSAGRRRLTPVALAVPLPVSRTGPPHGQPYRAGSSSVSRCSIRVRISSRIGRTASTPWPAGSSSFQSS